MRTERIRHSCLRHCWQGSSLKQVEYDEQQAKEKRKKNKITRKRARNEDGTYKADDPSTPDFDEAWEDGKP